MFLLDRSLCWSASDLTAAAECEYALLRTLDYTLGRAEPIPAADDPLMEHVARLGDRHEAQILHEKEDAGQVVKVERVSYPLTQASLRAARQQTEAAFAAEPDVVFQAALFDGEFFGYADFVERTAQGWLVCDAKLARQAKPRALLQLGAYADQLRAMGLPTSPSTSLLLGSGERQDFPLTDVLPVFRERRDRFRQLMADHLDGNGVATWGAADISVCGRCPECQHAATVTEDVVLVAGVRMSQRRKLAECGISTVSDLASASSSVRPAGMAEVTFRRIRTQARLQLGQMQAASGSPLGYELLPDAADSLARLPSPSEGDVFFDFEGDPLYDEGDPRQVGLEYLWGEMDTAGAYRARWAHSSAQERGTFEEFVDWLLERLRQFPDMHVYHYAPYETTALKRLAMRYQTREEDLDDLLRAEVFVDLYATVRGSVAVGASSYSIKSLEPLYMGDELRSEAEEAVAEGAASVVAYHEYRAMREVDAEAAAGRLEALQEYNEYDCLSTLRLRDWLLDRAVEAGVRESARLAKPEPEPEDAEPDPLFDELMAIAGSQPRSARTPEQQAYAMLANSIDYYRRERKQFWWEHFERLQHPLSDWSGARDVFVVESAQVEQDWHLPTARSRNLRRWLRLVGDWGVGSKRLNKASTVYASPGPVPAMGPAGAPFVASDVEKVLLDERDPRRVTIVESVPSGQEHTLMPVALVPGRPPETGDIEQAIKEVCTGAAFAPVLPTGAALDVLVRRRPRLRTGASLPSSGDIGADLVAALLAMDDSYLAVQGPPGSGKTYTGSRVIKELVEEHHWRIGVVAQSHAAVENLLGALVKAGLDPGLVGKSKNSTPDPSWTALKDKAPERAKFLAEHSGTGCVLGGTAWTFSSEKSVARGELDLFVVDEAGQFSLAPTLGASVSTQRLLLLGDPQQLPQVSTGKHAEPVDESALGWLMGEHDTIPPEYGYFLDKSYRMHPHLCEKVSVLSYDGRLTSAPRASGRHLDGVQPGLAVVPVEHVDNRTESKEEADAVVDEVRSYLGRTWRDPDDGSSARPLAASDVLVVAPYNAQVALIRRVLDKAGLTDVRAGTVDKFQGQEAPIAIVSMTASSHGDVPRGMGFLLNRNRINVAVSRAQWRAVLIRSQALTTFMPTTADGLLELGAFVGLCSGSDGS